MQKERKDSGLPVGMYLKHGAYYLVRKGKWQRLANDRATALAMYATQAPAYQSGTVPELIEETLKAKEPTLSRSTMLRYRTIARRINKAFIEFRPEQVRPVDIVKFMASLRDIPNSANHAMSVLKISFNYALERQLIESNPCVGVKRFKEAKRDRLLTAEEVQKIYDKAGSRLQCIIELCVRTGQRVGDVLTIPRSAIREEGIYFRQKKTDRQLIVGWTPELREAAAKTKALSGNVPGLALFHTAGKTPLYNTILKQWTDAVKAAGVRDANLHDLRAYAATVADAQGLDATALLGHSSPQITQRYLRDKTAKVVVGPAMVSFRKSEGERG